MTELDLTPHEPERPKPGVLRTARLRNLAVVGVIAAVLVFVLYQAITSARVFFLNVDEAVEQRDDLGDQTFRMQGTVTEETGVDAKGAKLAIERLKEANDAGYGARYGTVIQRIIDK